MGPLIGLAFGDIANQTAIVVFGSHEFLGECLEKCRMRGWIVCMMHVERLDQAGAEKDGPYTIGPVLGEGLVVVGEKFAGQKRPTTLGRLLRWIADGPIDCWSLVTVRG